MKRAEERLKGEKKTLLPGFSCTSLRNRSALKADTLPTTADTDSAEAFT